MTSQIELNVTGNRWSESSPKDESSTVETSSMSPSVLKRLKWWLMVAVCIFCLLAGQIIGLLLLRLYFNEGGNSIWLATLLQSIGFPVLFVPLFMFSANSPSTVPTPKMPLLKISVIYTCLGILVAGVTLMYSYGLLWLPISTYSLLCASTLAFNAVFSYFLNAQKFTALIFNSVVLLTFSAALLGVQSDSDSSSNIPKGKYPFGFLLTLVASASNALFLSLTQLTFQKVVKTETFSIVLKMQICVAFIASLTCVVGLLATGEWRGLNSEMENYGKGRIAYVMTVLGIAVAWQVNYVGVVGLVFVVTSLFANVISTLALPVVPIFAVIFFHDKMTGVKIMSILIAIWGFFSYIYQHYLDDQKAKKKIKNVARNCNVESVP